MEKIGILADDLTGATTAGVLLARDGIKTAAFFASEDINRVADAEAIVLSSDSRALGKEKAQSCVREAMEALISRGVTHFTKRIDTTLRGGIGFEVDAMMEYLDEDTIAVMVPAMPQSNRIVVGGYSLIDGVALSKTGVANDVRTPVRESHVPTLYKQQTNQKVGQVQLASVLAGKDYLKKALEQERSDGAKVIIIDATSVDDIELIAQSVIELNWNVLAIDPGPFTERLVALSNISSSQKIQNVSRDTSIENSSKKILVVAGSATEVTKKQIKHLITKSYTQSFPLDSLKLITLESSEKEIERAYTEVLAASVNDENKIFVLDTAVFSEVLDLEKTEEKLQLEKGEGANRINRNLGKLVKKVLESPIGAEISGLYMTGGDTMVNVLKTIGAKGILLKDYVIPQTDLGEVIGSEHEGLVIVGKGGLTGKETTALDAIQRIYQEVEKSEKELI